MPLSPGDLAPNFILQELCKGSHPYRQSAERPKFHFWEHFSEKPRLLLFMRHFPSYPGEELFAFLDENFARFSEFLHIIPVINANFATFVDIPYRNGGYEMPLYCLSTDDIRKFNQLSTAGTQPFMGCYLIEPGIEPKILEYLSFTEMGETLHQEILAMVNSQSKSPSPVVASAVNTEEIEDGVN